MTAAIRQWYRLAAAIIIANTALILRFIFAHNRNCRHLFYRTARRAHGAVSIAAAMRYQSTQYAARQCKLSIYPARHLFYRGNDGGNVAMLLSIAAAFGGGGNVVIYRRAAMQVINRRHLFYRTARRAHGAVNYRGGNAGYQSIRRAIFSIAVMTAAAMLLSIAARQCKLLIAAIFSIARRAVRTARFLSRQ